MALVWSLALTSRHNSLSWCSISLAVAAEFGHSSRIRISSLTILGQRTARQTFTTDTMCNIRHYVEEPIQPPAEESNIRCRGHSGIKQGNPKGNNRYIPHMPREILFSEMSQDLHQAQIVRGSCECRKPGRQKCNPKASGREPPRTKMSSMARRKGHSQLTHRRGSSMKHSKNGHPEVRSTVDPMNKQSQRLNACARAHCRRLINN